MTEEGEAEQVKASAGVSAAAVCQLDDHKANSRSIEAVSQGLADEADADAEEDAPAHALHLLVARPRAEEVCRVGERVRERGDERRQRAGRPVRGVEALDEILRPQVRDLQRDDGEEEPCAAQREQARYAQVARSLGRGEGARDAQPQIAVPAEGRVREGRRRRARALDDVVDAVQQDRLGSANRGLSTAALTTMTRTAPYLPPANASGITSASFLSFSSEARAVALAMVPLAVALVIFALVSFGDGSEYTSVWTMLLMREGNHDMACERRAAAGVVAGLAANSLGSRPASPSVWVSS